MNFSRIHKAHIHKDKVGALIFLIFSVAYGVSSRDIKIPLFAEEDVFNSRTLPIALAILGGTTSLLLLILPSSSGKEASVGEAFRGLYWKEVILLLILMVVYGLTIKVVGFIVSTILFLALGFWILGERRIKVILLTSVPLVLVFWYILSQLLDIYIDPGSFFYFLRGM
ncbi:tripartite tricarboxylate transporter TctB family protein [Candidatus Spongiihabitans sp.]|uniref:tripartite tricarboxylate transporter TctB family protein n=1 Tax=Candidatus Spongiihabitans sp. TaxID=3101308 RepID=UPI003C6FCF9B